MSMIHKIESYWFVSGTLPRVRTPNVVDFPLSTFPTTAHLTSGVSETLGGGNRSNRDARTGAILDSNSKDACGVIASELDLVQLTFDIPSHQSHPVQL